VLPKWLAELFEMEGEGMFISATREFNALNNWIGWGDPVDGVWFVGVEAGGGWDCSSPGEIEDRRNMIGSISVKHSEYKNLNERDEDDDGQGVNFPIAVVTAKVAAGLSEKETNWSAYRDKYLWLKGEGVFNSNMLQIGKRNLNEWPEGYKSLFGYTHKEYSDKLADVLQYRSQQFHALKTVGNPQAVVCFGKSHWQQFKVFMNLDGCTVRDVPEMACQIFPDQKVILTRHFSNGMPDKIVDYIVSVLRQWEVKIP